MKFLRGKKTTIRTRLALMTAVLVAGISVFIYLYFPASLEQRAQLALAAKGHTMSSMMAHEMAPALAAKDLAMMDGALDAPLQDKDVVFIIILDESGHVVSGAREGIADRLDYLNAENNKQLSNDKNVFIVRTPIVRDGMSIGDLYLGLSLKELRTVVASSKTTMLGLSILIFVLGMLCVLAISTVITAPLRNMITTVEHIAHGDLTQRADVPSLVEVQQLAEAFNMMVENVESRTEDLQLEVHQRTRAEDALRFSEARYRLLFDGNPYPLWVYDASTLEFLAVNNAAVEHYGFSKEEFLSMKLDDPRMHEDISSHGKHYWQLPATIEHTGIWKHRRRDGLLFSVEITSHELMYESRHARLVLAIDVTEREKAQEQVREQAALLDITSEAIMVRDLDDCVLYWNHGAEVMYGWTREEALGKKASELLYAPEQTAAYDDARKILFEKGSWSGEFKHKNKTDEILIIDSKWTLMLDEADSPKSVLVINSDVTERKKLEEQFLRSQRLQSIGTLAGGIAHDLNNVLAPMMLSLEIFRSKITEPTLVKLVDVMQSSTKRGSEIVKQVLTFARGFDGEKSDVRLQRLIPDLENVMRDTFPKMVHIKTTYPKQLWTVSGDYTKLYQVLMNLCVNARDAMPKGGNLNIEAENVFVDEHYASMQPDANVGPYVVLTVADTGQGIPPGVIDKIFEPFYTTKEVGKGTGLGLSTVLGIIKSHGGFVNVYSEVGKGARFKVYLPALETAEVENAIKQLSILPNGNGELVLVVDDEPAIREVNKVMLEEHGYRVMTASDGPEALALGAQHKGKIDIVITDMMMPFMDGPATIRALRKLDPNLKFLVISGLVGDQQIVEDFGKDEVPFLQKPFSTDRLLTTLQEVLAA
ncbi:MAG TPA: PAS domain S-box protein [Bacteroidota bacterium]|nr:PAS domain S-box protein [Bacteroidota bacterium]